MTTQAYFLPESVDEALGLLAEHGPDLMVMAGGTLAMPLINEGVSIPEKIMGLRRAGLDTVRQVDGALELGATATLTQVAAQDAIPLLGEAARHIGGWAIRNMGTVGGNLFAPPPAGDLAAALLALDATVTLMGKNGERTLPLADFFTGFMATAVEPGEIVTGVRVPLPEGRAVFFKHARKSSNTPSIVTVVAHLVMDGDTVGQARIALNGVGPHPLRARAAEAALTGQPLDATSIEAAAEAAASESEPFTDAIASEWYRRKMTRVFVRRALEALAG